MCDQVRDSQKMIINLKKIEEKTKTRALSRQIKFSYILYSSKSGYRYQEDVQSFFFVASLCNNLIKNQKNQTSNLIC